MSMEASRTKVIARVKDELVRHKLRAKHCDPDLFRAFAEDAIHRIRGPFLAQHTSRQIVSYLEEVFVFAQQRSEDGVAVAVRPGRQRGGLVVSLMDDQPFIVDTIRLAVRRAEAEYEGGFNIIFRATRDEHGRLTGVGEDAGQDEALTLIETDERMLRGDADARAHRIAHQLRLAQFAVRDFAPMTRAVERFIERSELLAERRPDQRDDFAETCDFLKWLTRENFVFMGAEVLGDPLGIQKVDGPYAGGPDGNWPGVHMPGMVCVRKSSSESPMHRAGRLDEVLIKLDDGQGRCDTLFIRGLFTYRAVTQPSRNVPILRQVLRDVLSAQNTSPGSFRYKGIANVFDSLPTEFLFTTSTDAISEMVDLVFESEQQQEAGVTLNTNLAEGSAFCLVSMPKAQYADTLRRDLQQVIVSTTGATYCDHGLFISRYDTVLLHYFLTGVREHDPEVLDRLKDELRELATPWVTRLWQALASDHGESRADDLIDTYSRAFPEAYVRATPAAVAARDVAMFEALTGEDGVLADAMETDAGQVVLRIYQARDVFLTDLVPVLDHFGLTVVSAESTILKARGGMLHLDTCVLSLGESRHGRFLLHKDVVVDALPKVFAKVVEDDSLNELTLTAGLSWRAIDVLRAYTNWLKQLGLNMALPRVRSILRSHPITACALWELFEAKFDPDLRGDRGRVIRRCVDALNDLLRLIQSHDEDLVMQAIFDAIQATLRTNVFCRDAQVHSVSFKLDPSRVPLARGEIPHREIYVYHREVEGVHLRFGRVARGGLRWSDRADFRTEVLSLVSTQQVKNVVIVPEGSKGGFYLRYPPADPGQRRKQANRLYEVFIRGMLDLTDNVVEGEVVGPKHVIAHDDPDPYLVVAADKGTAALSDTANELSAAYNFWLGDAFASGGSNGYDHKGVGITARGAWVLVRRHFADMGRDPYAAPFTCAGVGDMGGDVFGNGLLETPHTKLVAAFNHLHIFLDPDPDPQASYEERKRLFEAAGAEAGWDRYNKDLLSRGGMVCERSVKSVTLSEQAQRLLGIDRAEASPEEIIRYILRLDVDLLWMGGIGTYVKASHEGHEQADDRSNDRARVNADELRAKVLGEGANLSFTAAARIEAAERGVRLNADFIDNSGGVDMSDHEVNLKILLQRPVQRGELSEPERNKLLADLTEEVAALVLANNDSQGRQLSRDAIRTCEDVFPFGRAISFVERVFDRPRERMYLPSDEDLAHRAEEGRGLTRPELATLSAYVKRFVYKELISSGRAKELRGYERFLVDYFPKHIQEHYGDDLRAHQLADEIAMTMATTRVVSDVGAAFIPLTVESTGRTVFEIVDAYLRAQDLARTADVRATLEELRPSVALPALNEAWVRVDAGCRAVTAYWLAAGHRLPTDQELAEMRAAADEVYDLQAEEVARRNAKTVEKLIEYDIPKDVALRVAKAKYLDTALAIWSHAKKLGVSLRETIIRQLAAGRATRLQDLIDHLSQRRTQGEWEPIAIRLMVGHFQERLREVVLKLGTSVDATTVDDLTPKLAQGALSEVRAQVDELYGEDAGPELAALLVLEERLQAAIEKICA